MSVATPLYTLISSEAANILIIAFLSFTAVLLCGLCRRGMRLRDIEAVIQDHNVVKFDGDMDSFSDAPMRLASHFDQMLNSGHRLPQLKMTDITETVHIQRDTLRLKGTEYDMFAFFTDASRQSTVRLYWGVEMSAFQQLIHCSPDKKEDEIDSKPVNSEVIGDRVPVATGLSFIPTILCAHASAEVSVRIGVNQAVEVPLNNADIVKKCCRYEFDAGNPGLVPMAVIAAGYGTVEITLVHFVSKGEDVIPVPVVWRQAVKNASDTVELNEVYSVTGSGSDECVVCLSEIRTIILLPCRHYCVCHECFEKLSTCPVCRARYQSFVSLSS